MAKVDNQQKFSIMEPMEPAESTFVKEDLPSIQPDLVNDAEFKSIPFINGNDPQDRSFLLMDGDENLSIATPELFCKKLHCSDKAKIKVVSIFGNTGDGKSHTMNHIFFNGEEVFKTSEEQNSCTIGVYAALQPDAKVLCLDTEGLLGTTNKSNRRTRMLLKILAISDIVIYRTRSERLHSDMYDFLGTASKAFCTHFSQALQSLAIPGTTKNLGPAVIIFHETRNTKPLESSVAESAEDKLRSKFDQLNIEMKAFSSLRYVGVRTANKSPTNYKNIIDTITKEIENTAVRSPRQASVVFKAMKALNKKFSGEIIEKPVNPFPEEYFTCPVHCESCGNRCQRSMGHGQEGEDHWNGHPCKYQHQYDNKVYLCKDCHTNGKKIVVTICTQGQSDNSWMGLAKYAWKGAVIECPQCGEIYRSRQYWYGNKSPEDVAVRAEIVHVWKGGNITAKGPVHSAQMVLDNVTYLTEAIANLSAPHAKTVKDKLTDLYAPSYWRPNHEITHCYSCNKNFEKAGLPKHHCRGCGEGFCDPCSQHKMPVPSRGWKDPVRVCNNCRHLLIKKDCSGPEHANAVNNMNSNHVNNTTGSSEEKDIMVRKYTEMICNTISSVATVAVQYPKEIIKENARPSYWTPDSEAPCCYICNIRFGTAEELEHAKRKGQLVLNGSSAQSNAEANGLTQNRVRNKDIIGDCHRHHCRSCGKAVCDDCSQTRRPVPEQGWLTNVRVCDSCACVDAPPQAMGVAASVDVNANGQRDSNEGGLSHKKFD